MCNKTRQLNLSGTHFIHAEFLTLTFTYVKVKTPLSAMIFDIDLMYNETYFPA
jgi:hypothetical protein